MVALDEELVRGTKVKDISEAPPSRRTQCIAHRGLNNAHAENSLPAFVAAVRIRAQALETDLHLTKDGVVVLSHDATLSRCFGVNKKIIDCDYSYIRTLRTLKSPHARIATLQELLEYLLGEPKARGIWVLLDIKADNNADAVMEGISGVLRKVRPQWGWKEWGGMVVLGVWMEKFVDPARKHLPGFPIVHITPSIVYAKRFMKHEDVGFNIFWLALTTRQGKEFLKQARREGRNVFCWTNNQEVAIKWAIDNKLINGVCTDNPESLLKLEETYLEVWSEVPNTIRIKLWFGFWIALLVLVEWICKLIFIFKELPVPIMKTLSR